jgi:transcriptional regulator with XRE-family HTH domain
MDKRRKPRDREAVLALRDGLYQGLAAHRLDLAEAVRQMQRVSGLTQPEFAQHRGVSVQALRQIVSGKGNPTVETLNKIGEVFGLEVGFVPRVVRGEADKQG